MILSDCRHSVISALLQQNQMQISLATLKSKTRLNTSILLNVLNRLFLEGLVSRQTHFGGHTYIYRLEIDEERIRELRAQRSGQEMAEVTVR